MKKEYIELEYREVDNLIQEYLGHPFETLCCQEANNGSSYTFHVDGQVDDYDMREINEFKKTGKYGTWTTGIYLNYLASLDIIEKGDYLVHTSW